MSTDARMHGSLTNENVNGVVESLSRKEILNVVVQKAVLNRIICRRIER